MLVHPPGPPCLRLQGKMYHSDCLSISLEAFGPLPAGKWVAVMQVHCCLPSGQKTAELLLVHLHLKSGKGGHHLLSSCLPCPACSIASPGSTGPGA